MVFKPDGILIIGSVQRDQIETKGLLEVSRNGIDGVDGPSQSAKVTITGHTDPTAYLQDVYLLLCWPRLVLRACSSVFSQVQRDSCSDRSREVRRSITLRMTCSELGMECISLKSRACASLYHHREVAQHHKTITISLRSCSVGPVPRLTSLEPVSPLFGGCRRLEEMLYALVRHS